MLTSFHFGRAIWTATSQLLQSFKVLSCSVVPDFSDACRSAIEKSNIFGSLNLIFELTEKTIQSFLVFKSYFSHRQIHFHWDSEVFPFLNSRTCDQSLIADFYHLSCKTKNLILMWVLFISIIYIVTALWIFLLGLHSGLRAAQISVRPRDLQPFVWLPVPLEMCKYLGTKKQWVLFV